MASKMVASATGLSQLASKESYMEQLSSYAPSRTKDEISSRPRFRTFAIDMAFDFNLSSFVVVEFGVLLEPPPATEHQEFTE